MAEREQADIKFSRLHLSVIETVSKASIEITVEFYFKQMCKLRVFDSPPDLITDEVNLLVISNKYGFIFVAAGLEITMISTATLEKLTSAKDADLQSVASNYEHKSISVGHEVRYVALSCDELTLAVAYKDKEQLLVGALDTRAFISQDANAGIFAKGLLTKSPDTYVKELHWNPENPNLLAVCLSNGHVSLLELVDNVFKILSSLSQGPPVYSVSWSPKGKHFIAGLEDGRILFYDKTLKQKKEIECPDIFDGVLHKVNKVHWSGTHLFSVVYVSKQDDDPDPNFVIVTSQKDGPNSFTNYGDIFIGVNEERKLCFYIKSILDWNIVLAVASNSFELAVVGKTDKWCGWQLGDSGRAEMPLTEDDNETFPVGIGVSLNSTLKVTEGEQVYPPVPLLLMLSTDGLLLSYQMVNKFPGTKYDIVRAAVPLLPDEVRKPRARSPKKATSPSKIEVPSTVDGSSQGQKSSIPTFNFGSSAPLPTPFNTTTTKSSAPAFNFSFATQSTASVNPFSMPKTDPTATVATQPSSSFNLSGSKQMGTTFTGQPTNTVSAAQPFNFSFGKSTAANLLQSNSVTTSSGILTSQPVSGGSLKKPPVAPIISVTSKPLPSSVASVPSTQPALIVFTQKPLVGSIPGSSMLSSGSSKSPSSSAFSVVTSQPPPNVSVTLIGSSTLPPGSGFQTVKATMSQPSGFSAAVPATKSVSVVPPNDLQKRQSPSLFGGSPSTAVTQKMPASAGRGSASSSPFQPGTGMPQATKGTPPAAKPGTVAQNGPQASMAFSQQTWSTPPSMPAQRRTTESPKADKISKDDTVLPVDSALGILRKIFISENRPCYQLILAFKFVAEQMALQLDLALGKSIVEEITYFSKELTSFKSSMANVIHTTDLIGTSEELTELRGGTERCWRTTDGFRDISKEHKQEVAQLKAKMLQAYDLLEETEMRKDKVQDPRYVHLLKSRPLDPVTDRQRKEIRAQVNRIENLIKFTDCIKKHQSDVNDALDAVWEERQQQKTKARNRTLKTNGIHNIYRTMESIEQITNNLAERLEGVTLDAQRKRLVSLNTSLRSQTSRQDEELPRTSVLGDLSILSETAASPSKPSRRVSPQKQAQLRKFLMRRPETPVRRSRYQAMIPKVVPKAASTPASHLRQQKQLVRYPQEEAIAEAHHEPSVSVPSTVAAARAALERIKSSAKGQQDSKVLKTPFRTTPPRVPTNTPASPFGTKLATASTGKLAKAMSERVSEPKLPPWTTQTFSPPSFGFSSQASSQQKPANFSETSVMSSTTKDRQQATAFKIPDSVPSEPPKVSFSLGEEQPVDATRGPVRNLFGSELSIALNEKKNSDLSLKQAPTSSSSITLNLSQRPAVSQDKPGSAFSFSMSAAPVKTMPASFGFVKPSPSFDSLATAAATKEGTTAILSKSATTGSAKFSFPSTAATSGSPTMGFMFGPKPSVSDLPGPRSTESGAVTASSSGPMFGLTTKSPLSSLTESTQPSAVSNIPISSVPSVTSDSSAVSFVVPRTVTTASGLSVQAPVALGSGPGRLETASSSVIASTASTPFASSGLFKVVTTPYTSLFSTTTAFSSGGGLLEAKPVISSTVTPLVTVAPTPVSTAASVLSFPNTTSSGGLLGAALPSSASTLSTSSVSKTLFGAPTSIAAGATTFGSLSVSSSSTCGLFGTKTTSSAFGGGLFGAPSPSSASSSGMPGISTTPNTSSFGTSIISSSAPTSTTNGLFGSSSTSTSLFGSTASSGMTATSNGGQFGAPTANSKANTSLQFGAQTKSTSSGLFTSTVASTPSGGLFGVTSSASSTVFGGQAQPSGGLFSSQPSGGLFSSNPTGGLFGAQASSSTSSGMFGSGSLSTGLFGSSSSTAPGLTTATPSFGQSSSGFGGQQPQQPSSGFGFGGFGLGGKPTNDPSKNPFGSVPTNVNPTSASTLFGSSAGGGGSFSSQGSSMGKGAFSKGFGSGFASGSIPGGVTAGGFGGSAFGGQSPSTVSTAFGGAPAFGGSPSFGASPSFGGAPAFGGSATFGSSPQGGIFGSKSPTVGGQTPSGGTGFAALASQSGSPTFGALAAQPGTPSFGSMAAQNQTGFGSGNQGGFGTGSQGGFGGFGGGQSFGSQQSPGGSSFSSWR